MTDPPRQRAVIIGVELPGVSPGAHASSLAELGRLARTLGLDVVDRVSQKRPHLEAAAVLGSGKLDELVERKHEMDVVLVDHDITPSQLRNLERRTGLEVLDRTGVILAIFRRHARTHEARLEVEIARLTYQAPRLRESGVGKDRQAGGIGGKGAGESTLELDRRKIRDRIAELRHELAGLERNAEQRRARRGALPTVALVGYTNAGKSSLMRVLTGSGVEVADKLFATLGTTVRSIEPETRPRILVSDTVGFIKDLPHHLVSSFRSTLAELRNADLLLHVVDASDAAHGEQAAVTLDVIDDLGASEIPRLTLMNKMDRVSADRAAELRTAWPRAVFLSAKRPADVADLRERIVHCFERDMVEEEVLVPYDRQRFVAELHESFRVLEERYDDRGAHLLVRAAPEHLERLRHALAEG